MTIDAGSAWLAVLAVANTLFYYLRVVGPMHLQTAAEPVPVLGRWAASTVAVGAGAVVLLGVLANPSSRGSPRPSSSPERRP